MLSVWNVVVVYGKKLCYGYCWNLHGIHKPPIFDYLSVSSPHHDRGWVQGEAILVEATTSQMCPCPFRQQPVIWWDDEPGEAYSHINFDLQQDLPPPLMPWKASSCKGSVALLLAPLFTHCESCWLAAHWHDSLAWCTHWNLKAEDQGSIQELPWQRTFFLALSRMFHSPPHLSGAQCKTERKQIG